MSEMKNKTLTIGEMVKITGGKYKKYGKGKLITLKPTYCDVELEDTIVKKVKIDYLFPMTDMLIEMPEAQDLVKVENPDEYIEQSKNDEQVIKEKVEEVINEVINMEDMSPEEEDIHNTIEELEKKAHHWHGEASVYCAERDQADAKVIEQDKELDSLRKRNEYLEEIIRKILLP